MKILIWPNPILKQVSEPVMEPLNMDFVNLMIQTMQSAGGVGLSAIQVGLPKTFFVMGGTFAPPLCVVNPYILTYIGTPAPTIEGCLSLPGQFDLVERFPQVEVSFCTHDLENRVEMILSGLEAQCFQHEYEHLQGKLFVDKLPGGRRDQIRSNLRKLKQSGKI